MTDTEETKCSNGALCDAHVFRRDGEAGGDGRGDCDLGRKGGSRLKGRGRMLVGRQRWAAGYVLYVCEFLYEGPYYYVVTVLW